MRNIQTIIVEGPRTKQERFHIMAGIYFGYPWCCIKEFITDDRNGIEPGTRLPLQFLGDGFVPCRYHTIELIKGGIKSKKDLIVNRICETRFPIAHPGWKSELKIK